MDKKEKLVKAAKTGYAVSKTCYIIACVLCVACIALAVVLPLTVKNSEIPPMEFCAVFLDGALVTFFAIGILWNTEQWFRSIVTKQSPFTARLPHYLKKTGIITVLASIIPSVVSTAVIQSAVPDSELVFDIGISGIFCGILLIAISGFFRYGYELQQKDDETL